MNRLEEILAVKRAEVERLRPIAKQLVSQALSAQDFRGFSAALQRSDEQLAIIGEVKKASPSVGVIDPNFDAAVKAREYEAAGAEAISVLTYKTVFQGSMADLAAVHDVGTI